MTELTIKRAPSPLDYPEILLAVGKSIPIFIDNNNTWTYKPNTILTCCRVSKFWRDVLLPWAWRVHDVQLMGTVPKEELEKNKDFVRFFRCIYTYRSIIKPTLYTNLQEMVIDRDLTSLSAVKLIRCNNNLKRLKISYINLSQAMVPQDALDGVGELSIETYQAKGQIAYPLEHLESVLQELTLLGITFNGREMWRVLCPVSRTLRSLTLHHLKGTLEDIPLEDLVFTKVTHLSIQHDPALTYPIEEFIGRCPVLEHLEIGWVDPANPLENMVSILEGVQRLENRRQREAREKKGILKKQFIRPQLSSLHLLKHPNISNNGIWNSPLILATIRACSHYQTSNESKKEESANNNPEKHQYQIDSGTNNGNNDDDGFYNSIYKGFGYREKSLRELKIELWVLDDSAREAIETHRYTLEILKIHIRERENRKSTLNLEWQGRVLRPLLRTCRRLKEVEYWDRNHDADVSWIVEEMLRNKSTDADTVVVNKTESNTGNGRESDSGFSEEDESKKVQMIPSEAWHSPALESLSIKAGKNYLHGYQHMKDGRRFNVTGILNNGLSTNIEWNMAEQGWVNIYDGSETFLGSRWEVFELFNEDETQQEENEEDGLLLRFLRLIAPSQRLKNLRLGQLTLHR